ncbi:hypothetical protein CLV62_10494 [Dysgonomonas alginatilytica]|uniref:Uncharacterized protein n=1 Tax=Dysgonomonas alginatilytica TaxID=1605892 RepID=A0A2V3PT82_9BACT|nr:hypothetical protein [Dysgonomonas alginatilytica]PXV66833.1 hypothetical protein CLV62_10494 [Dysgonomonas alginatilytica]
MTDNEAKRIVSDLLTERGDTEITVHEIIMMDSDAIQAKTSYVWYLNGWRKEVSYTETWITKDGNCKWCILL